MVHKIEDYDQRINMLTSLINFARNVPIVIVSTFEDLENFEDSHQQTVHAEPAPTTKHTQMHCVALNH